MNPMNICSKGLKPFDCKTLTYSYFHETATTAKLPQPASSAKESCDVFVRGLMMLGPEVLHIYYIGVI